jgi:hypothetical protein
MSNKKKILCLMVDLIEIRKELKPFVFFLKKGIYKIEFS